MRTIVRNGMRGFGLIELMVTLVVLGVILIAVFSSFIQTNDASEHASAIVEQRQSARAAVQLIERDIRMAGSGWGRNPVNYWSGGASAQIWAIAPGPSASTCDSIRLMGAWQANTTLISSMAAYNSAINVSSVAGFAAGDLIVVTDGTSAHMFQVTGVNTGTKVLEHATSSSWNPTGAFANWPSGGYPANRTFVYKISMLTYRIDSTSYNRPCLIRTEFGQPISVVVYGVDRFQVWYRIQGYPDSLTRSPNVSGGVNLLDKVQPRVFTRVTERNRPTYVDSVWADIQPRTF